VIERIKAFFFRQVGFARRRIMAVGECTRCFFVSPTEDQLIYIVSCERNAGAAAIRCLDSVYRQNYLKSHLRHLFIDDASDDGTAELIRNWLAEHPDHNVEYIHNSVRVGGTANTVSGFRKASEPAVVVELNGDDWLPDKGVASFFNKVYADSKVWMTYNTLRMAGGPPAPWAKPIPAQVVAENAFRDLEDWQSSHLHTFKQQLLDHVDDDLFIDPETGDYWECADDQAFYLALLELSGKHARHINRITCVYNFWEESHAYYENDKSVATTKRIREMKRYQPLKQL